MSFDINKYIEPACRVFNGTARKEQVSLNDREVLDINDEEAIRSLCHRVFDENGQIESMDAVWKFNTILVQVAEQFIVKPNFDKIFNVIATTKQVDKKTSLLEFTVEKDYNIKFSMVATNSGHKLVKIGNSGKVAQVPFNIGFGATYDPLTKGEDEIEWYKRAVKEIGRAQIVYIYNKCLELLNAAGALPTSNVVEGDSVKYAQVRDLASTIRRRTNGRPVLLADEVLLDSLGKDMASDSYFSKLMWDGLAEELFGAYAPKNFGTFDGMALENPYIDAENSKVALPVNEGIMFAASNKYKPLAITKIGSMTQKTHTELKNDRVQFWVEQELAITLLYPQFIGRVKDTDLSL